MTSKPAPRNKKKAKINYQEDFFKICTDTLKTTNNELSELDIVGMHIGKKFAKINPIQAIYAGIHSK